MSLSNTNEQDRLQQADWKKWGPYVTDRQWGTVREDYSANGDAWGFTTHDMARSKAWRWGEEGIGGICDRKQLLCFAVALWNKKDPIIKERYFGLTNYEGNHGEDVKELYYYLDSTPTHSYMKMLYKYPQKEFPYQELVDENKKRSRYDAEFEMIDTGIFDDDKYFDIFIEYAKASVDDILIQITVCNRGNEDAALHVLPTLWFRNTWAWGYDEYKPELMSSNDGQILIRHKDLGDYVLHFQQKSALLFCDNETNSQRLYSVPNHSSFVKDGINDYLIYGDSTTINRNAVGTKAAGDCDLFIKAGQTQTIKLRLEAENIERPFDDFDSIFAQRINDADEFYAFLQKDMKSQDQKSVQRQALAGMLWSKQFYYYNIQQWLNGDPLQPPPPPERKEARNHDWMHLNNADIISMPDKWEYPWYASWDLSFHCISLSLVDAAFAKQQLLLLVKDWYLHPNGQLPSYEWSFGAVNPPVQAWAAWRVYEMEAKSNNGSGDIGFLETIFHKFLVNFTWWVNRKDAQGNNIFEGGFLGLDNIGVFDRNAQLTNGGYIEQADATSWMAMYSLNMMRMALELSSFNPVYQHMATKFFEHFLYIAGAIDNMGVDAQGLWDDEDSFFYDVLRLPDGKNEKLKVRSVVGLIPLFAVEVLDHELLTKNPRFAARLDWFLNNRPDLASLVSRWQQTSENEMHLLSLLRGRRMKKLLQYILDETEFLSAYGVRALSKAYEQQPYQLSLNGNQFSVRYEPGESTEGFFGGNSNWRGPVWMPINYLLIESLQRFHYYYGDDFKVECPKGSGVYLSLNDVADELCRRLAKIFLQDSDGKRPLYADYKKFQTDPQFKDYILFHEYFNGDNGKGLGASHQTGWTGLIAKLLLPRKNPLDKIL